MVGALLTASGHVQDAERTLRRMCCWLVMTAYCTSSAAGTALLPTMQQTQGQVAAKKKSVKELVISNWQVQEAQISVSLVQSPSELVQNKL